VADEAYVRESIVSPAAKVVAGYQPVMPTFQGQVTEEQLIALVAYIQSLQVPSKAAPAAAGRTSR
jgi:cytochrome c oxidase subunit 2